MPYKHAIVMSDKPGISSTRSDGCQLHEVAWNELPVDVVPSEVDGVIFDDSHGRHTDLPSVISQLPNVRWVSIEARTVGMLRPSVLPHLAELVIAGTSDAVMPEGPWAELRMLRASDAKLQLRAADLPALHTLEMLFKTKADLTELGKLRSLQELQIGPMKDGAMLTPLAGLPLRSLRFKRGSIEDLGCLAHWPRLEEFGAILCHKIRDLSPLATMSGIRRASFVDSSGLRIVDALFKMEALKFVVFWGCRDNDGVLSRAVKKLRAQGVEVQTDL